jgi:hypothetical protein
VDINVPGPKVQSPSDHSSNASWIGLSLEYVVTVAMQEAQQWGGSIYTFSGVTEISQGGGAVYADEGKLTKNITETKSRVKIILMTLLYVLIISLL